MCMVYFVHDLHPPITLVHLMKPGTLWACFF